MHFQLYIDSKNHWKSKNLFIRKPLYKKSIDKNDFLIEVSLYIYIYIAYPDVNIKYKLNHNKKYIFIINCITCITLLLVLIIPDRV